MIMSVMARVVEAAEKLQLGIVSNYNGKKQNRKMDQPKHFHINTHYHIFS